jgi:amidohydrolase
MSMSNRIREIVQTKEQELIAIRRHLHAHPELSYQEENTMAFISEQLSKAGIPHQTKVGGFGIVGLIEGRNPEKRVIALRGDMDALPITEQNDVVYKSCHPGVMHACGHDVHSTCLLGAALALNEIRHELEGTVKLIFQPAEEKLPGGASIMIQDGALQNPTVSTILGQHVLPQMEVGKVGFRGGIYMASCDEIFITVKGPGGHGAQPNLTVDTVLVAAHIVVALQQIVSRRANPIMPTVLSIGKMIAQGATNIIPQEVYMEGTLRTFDEKWRAEAKKHIRSVVEGIGSAMNAEIDLRIEDGYPYLKNDEALTQQAFLWAKEYLGDDKVEELPIRLTAEDFSYYTHLLPACFYRLGTGNVAKGITSGIHTPTFDIDEAALTVGAGLMAWIAYKQLSE